MAGRDEIVNVAASVQQRLRNRAREMEADYGLVLQRYTAERFLYRLGVSSEVDRFTLKGASLFLVWTGDEFRATRDVDLLGSGAEDHAAIREAMAAICAINDPHDAIRFDPQAIHVEEIRQEQRYGGVRAKLRARLGKTRILLQVDIGFGDIIYPGREQAEYPTLLGGETPRVWAYPRETVIAEKFEAMVSLGARNSRMKDFWDVAALSQEFPFDGETLRTAIDETFRRRGTPIGEAVPEALRPAFYQDEKRSALGPAVPDREARVRELLLGLDALSVDTRDEDSARSGSVLTRGLSRAAGVGRPEATTVGPASRDADRSQALEARRRARGATTRAVVATETRLQSATRRRGADLPIEGAW